MQSYLVHNFKRRSYVNRWTPKKSLVWLSQNAAAIYLTSINLLASTWSLNLPFSLGKVFYPLTSELFKKSLLVRTTSLILFSNYPYTVQITLTLKYWLIQFFKKFLDGEPLPRFFSLRFTNLIYNKYNLPVSVLLTRSTKKIFRSTFNKWLVMLTFFWFSWSRRYKFSVQHSNLPRNFLILNFLNLYYFKVFNL